MAIVSDATRTRYYNPSSPRIARQFLILIGLFILFSTFFIILLFDPSSTVQATTSFVSLTLENIASTRARCNSQCPGDPFTKPGTLVYGSNFSDTRWIPFPPHQISLVPLQSSDIQYDAPVPRDALDLACPQYMKMLSVNGSSEMDWAKNKTVLFIGSSHDRNNIQFFCEELGGIYTNIGGHLAGACNVTSHNLVLAFWFIYGSIDSDSFDWYAKLELRPLRFESRIQQMMLPWMAAQNISDPDLIVETSLFWDDGFLNQRASHMNHIEGPSQPLTYSELAWHRSRLHALVAYTRTLFGADVPIMFRTRHPRESGRWNRIRRIFQLDQSLRVAAQELNTWGDLLEGESLFYDRDQHFPKGPVTWLFGDMILFYLKQTTTPGCRECYYGRR